MNDNDKSNKKKEKMLEDTILVLGIAIVVLLINLF
jgi:hypothetical protein